MNYTWKTVYGDQRLVDLARELRGKLSDSEEEEVNDDDYSDDNDGSDDYEFKNEDDDNDDDDEEEEDASSSEEEEEVKESHWNKVWIERYDQLKEYKAENGHCNVPRDYELNKALGTWVSEQRKQYRKMSQGVYSFMTQERVEKLESLGFSWVLRSKDTWNERFEELKEFKFQQGHCNVPRNYAPNKALSTWVGNQRHQYKLLSNGSKSQLTEDRIEKLESLGFAWNALKDTWNERFEELKQFKDQHGHCNVPQGNKALGSWVSNQRQAYSLMSKGSKSGMTEDRVNKLENIGFEWAPTKDIWHRRFQELTEYKAQHGHCNVPKNYVPNKALVYWVGTQRTQYKLWLKGYPSNITAERVEILENIGFEWVLKKCNWDERLEELKQYKVQCGHCNVPSDYVSNKALGNWVRTQRVQYKLMLEGSKSKMTEERVEKLENIGFAWRPLKDTWDERFQQLKEFKAQYGHFNVPYKYDANKALGYWCHKQRAQYILWSKGLDSAITREQVKKLESIEVSWMSIADTWNEKYEQLKEYKAQNGHCNVPYNYELNKTLGSWVSNQRKRYTRMTKGLQSQITREQIAMLENIGFVWTPKKDTWKERFEELKVYNAQHGHCNVPTKNESNKALGSWVDTQRCQYRKMSEGVHSYMTQERITMLENIGFMWDPNKDVWLKRLAELTEFKAQHGHCNVPYKYKSNKSLGPWVYHQKCQYKLMVEGSKSSMTEAQVKKLEKIGFEWSLKKRRIAHKNAIVKRHSKRLRSKK